MRCEVPEHVTTQTCVAFSLSQSVYVTRAFLETVKEDGDILTHLTQKGFCKFGVPVEDHYWGLNSSLTITSDPTLIFLSLEQDPLGSLEICRPGI